MDQVVFDAEFDFSLYHAKTEMTSMTVYCLVCPDGLYSNKPQRIYFDVNALGNSKLPTQISSRTASVKKTPQRMSSEMDIRPQLYTVKQRISGITFSDMRPDPNSPAYKWLDKHHKTGKSTQNLIPTDSAFCMYLFKVERDDTNLPCYIQAAATTFRVYDLVNAAKKNQPLKVVLKASLDTIGSVSLCATAAPVVKFSSGSVWYDISTMSLKHETVNIDREGNALVEVYARNTKTWVSRRFMNRFEMSSRINCYYDFNMLGHRFPVAFLLNRTAKTNALFFLNQFYYAMKRHLIRTQRLSLPEMKKMTLQGTLQIYTHSFGLRQRTGILAEMLTLVPTCLRYVTDHTIMIGSGETRNVEDFDSVPTEGGVMDCEDVTVANRTMLHAFRSCDTSQLKSSSGASTYLLELAKSVIEELKILAMCYIDMVCLDRVSIASASMIGQGVQQKSLTAHMNLMLLPVPTFIDRARLTIDGNGKLQDHSNNQAQDLENAFRSELYKQTGHRNALEKAMLHSHELLMESTEAPGGEWAISKSTLRSSLDVLPSLVLEGTGIYTPLDEEDAHKEIYKYMHSEKSGEVLNYSSDMIFHPRGDPTQFFLNVILCITTFWIDNYGVCASEFIATNINKSDRRFYARDAEEFDDDPYDEHTAVEIRESASARGNGLLTRMHPVHPSGDPTKIGRVVYGAEYRDFINADAGMRLVCLPFLESREKAVLFSQYKIQKSAPTFVIRDANMDAVLSRDQPLEQTQNIASLFEEDMSSCYEVMPHKPSQENANTFNRLITATVVKCSLGSDFVWRDPQTHIESFHGNANSKILDHIRLIAEDLKQKCTGVIANRASKQRTLNSRVKTETSIFMLDLRFLMYGKIVKDLVGLVENKTRIVDFDSYIELNTDRLWVLVLCFGVLSKTSGS